jgi:outer membrane protein OmpA-like peptidoglycan-associated protein
MRSFISEHGQAPDNRLLFFYSGHGYTNVANDFSYLVPVDASDPRTSFAAFQKVAIPIAEIDLLAKEITALHAVFMFDSCFSGSIFTTRSLPDFKPTEPQDRWRFLTGSAAKPVRQFIAAGGPTEEVPAKSVFLPLLLQALEGEAALVKDGYVTGREIGLFLEQRVPEFNKRQNPHSDVIKIPDLSFGDVVFQYALLRPHNIPDISSAGVTEKATAEEQARTKKQAEQVARKEGATAGPKAEAQFNTRLAPATLSEHAKSTLERVVAQIDSERTRGAILDKIEIVGFARKIGLPNDEIARSLAYANSVKSYFISRGLAEQVINVVGKGSDYSKIAQLGFNPTDERELVSANRVEVWPNTYVPHGKEKLYNYSQKPRYRTVGFGWNAESLTTSGDAIEKISEIIRKAAMLKFAPPVLSPQGKSNLDRIVTLVNDQIARGAKLEEIEIVGFARGIGLPDEEMSSSLAYASSAKTYLISRGLSEQSIRITAEGSNYIRAGTLGLNPSNEEQYISTNRAEVTPIMYSEASPNSSMTRLRTVGLGKATVGFGWNSN